MKKILSVLIIIFLASCSNSDLVEHEKLSIEATNNYLNAFTSIGVCSIDRPSFNGKNSRYSRKIKYKLCSESNSHVVAAPLTGLLHSIDINKNNVKVMVEKWQLEKMHYKEFQKSYLDRVEGRIHDALLVIKKDVQSRRDIASSNGEPLKSLDTLAFTFTEEEKEALANRMTAHECDNDNACIQL